MTAHPTGFSTRRFGTEQIRTPRDIEYDAFARATRQLQQAAQGHGSLAAAAHLNTQLWQILASDLAEADNGLPDPLRAGLLSLAIFSIRHGQAVMARGISPDALIDVNLTIMKGLRGEVAP
ncbi:flagellar biosynthesis regulator FlaF [Paracoccus luteus]|uniref:flagellar biosynthesis regulator FlaF n=1 Tax=Paracoccus luteus TaxID=2508543 RepID=UPI0010704935|nr:flagellar biosynthesis regulator FlaF [Paracoccus luteus]